MKRGRAQVALEYMIVIGIALSLLIPAVYLFSRGSSRTVSTTQSYQLSNIGSKIINNAEMIYSMGEPSWVILDLSFPDSILNFTILNHHELVFRYRINSYLSDIVFYSSIPLATDNTIIIDGINVSTLNISSGLNKLKLYVKDSYVYIEKQE